MKICRTCVCFNPIWISPEAYALRPQVCELTALYCRLPPCLQPKEKTMFQVFPLRWMKEGDWFSVLDLTTPAPPKRNKTKQENKQKITTKTQTKPNQNPTKEKTKNPAEKPKPKNSKTKKIHYSCVTGKGFFYPYGIWKTFTPGGNRPNLNADEYRKMRLVWVLIIIFLWTVHVFSHFI